MRGSNKRKHLKKGRRIIFKEQYLNWKKTYEKILQIIIDPSSQSLHSDIELSCSHFKRYKEYDIILSGLEVHSNEKAMKHIENCCYSYRNIIFGKHVQMSSITCDGI